MAVADSPTRPAPATATPSGGKPIIDGQRGMAAHVAVYVFVVVPLLALLAAIPVAWGWGLGWVDITLALIFYVISGLGITVGYHRYFTHGSFKANRPLRIALALAGSIAMQGPVITWVADHRRHHAFSDKEGDPHSPWLFGTGPLAVARGFYHSHTGWLFERDETNKQRFTPDLLADRGHRAHQQLVHRAVGGHPARAGGPRRPADLVLVGRADRAVLGRLRAGGAAAPRHLVDQLDLPHARRPAVRAPATSRATCGRWPCSASVSPGTTCTTPTRPAPGTACSAGRSTSRPG